MINVNFELNGKSRTESVDPVKRLSEFLRDDMGLSATKVGCNAGDCGSCTVMIDGKTACSCLVSASQINGSTIETLENMADDGQLTLLQRSFLHFGAAQCGICTPGMLISAKALLEKQPEPSHRDVEDALGGVLCRCTGYKKIIEAVVHAHEFADEELLPEAGKGVGSAIRHLDGVPKVDGTLKYGADTIPGDALYVRVIRSPYHHAKFTIGDKDAFVRGTAGVEAFFDVTDLPGKNCFGVIPPFADQPVFAEDVAIFRGEAVAAIVGDEDVVRRLDEADLPIQWAEIKHALLPDEAKDGKLNDIHDNRRGNILVEGYVEKGSIANGFANARHKVNVRTSTPFIEHAYIELEAGYCMRKGDRLELFGCTQAAMMDRDSLAEIMGLSVNDIRIMPSAVVAGLDRNWISPSSPILLWPHGSSKDRLTSAIAATSRCNRQPNAILRKSSLRLAVLRTVRLLPLILKEPSTRALMQAGVRRLPIACQSMHLVPISSKTIEQKAMLFIPTHLHRVRSADLEYLNQQSLRKPLLICWPIRLASTGWNSGSETRFKMGCQPQQVRFLKKALGSKNVSKHLSPIGKEQTRRREPSMQQWVCYPQGCRPWFMLVWMRQHIFAKSV